MMNRRPIRGKPSEDGYMLVAVMFLMAILVISMAVAAPRIKASIQRDREVETMERGKQYIRAVQLYYRKFHAYPPNIDALVKTQEIRFLRKKYIDPTTGKDEWKPIQFGQNKAPTAMGFFGQPLGGSSIAGTGPSGGNGLQGATPIGSSQFGSSQQGGLFQSNTPADPNAQQGQAGQDPNAANGTGASGSAAGGPGTGQPGQTFGGAGIIGFSPGSPKQSILVYKKKTHYNEWEFVYDPLNDQQGMAGGAGLNGQPVNGNNNNINSSNTNIFGGQTPTPQQPPQQPPPLQPPPPQPPQQ